MDPLAVDGVRLEFDSLMRLQHLGGAMRAGRARSMTAYPGGFIHRQRGRGLEVNDVRPWLADECVIWSIVHPFSGAQQHGPRGVTWTLGTYNPALCAYENPKIWLGYMSGDQSTAHFSRIDPPTGVIEETVQAPVWDGSGYAPYGGALDPGQHPWMTGLRGELVRINNDANPAWGGGQASACGSTITRPSREPCPRAGGL